MDMNIDLNNILKIDEIDYSSSDYTQTQLGFLYDFSNVINSINLSAYVHKQMVKDISTVFINRITELEEECSVYKQYILRDYVNTHPQKLTSNDDIYECVNFLMDYISIKKYNLYSKYRNIKNQTYDDLFYILNEFINDYDMNDKYTEIKTIDDAYSLIKDIFNNEGIKTV
jgi:hypothetical protein